MTMTRIEALEKFNDDTYQFEAGDTKSVPEQKAKLWCKYGWAKCVEGEFETGERIPGAAEIDPADLVADLQQQA